MPRVWDVKIAIEVVGGKLPGHVRDISDPAVLLSFVDQVVQAAAGGAFLVSAEARDEVGWAMLYGCPWGWSLGLQDEFGPSVSDVFTTRGPADVDEAWDFGRLFGQELEWHRRYFTEPQLVRPALAAYLSTRKLWRGVTWEPVPSAGLLIDDPIPIRSQDALEFSPGSLSARLPEVWLGFEIQQNDREGHERRPDQERESD